MNETALLKTIKEQRERIEELEETVRQLQTPELEPLPPGVPYLTVMEEKVLRVLLDRRGKVVSRDSIHGAVYDENSNTGTQVIGVVICKLRKKLKGLDGMQIETVGYRGWRIGGDTERSRTALTEVSQLIGEAIAA